MQIFCLLPVNCQYFDNELPSQPETYFSLLSQEFLCAREKAIILQRFAQEEAIR